MMKTNEQLFKIFIEDGFGKGDVTVFDRYASPDFSMTIEDLISDGDKVWGRMTARGTQKGQFGPIPPTNKKFEITVIDVMRFKEDKLVEHWGVPDRLALMEQLGMKPPPKLIMKLMHLLHS